jgi:hypothetical protein
LATRKLIASIYLTWSCEGRAGVVYTPILHVQVVSGSIAEGPVFPSSLDEIDDHVLRANAWRLREKLGDAFVEVIFGSSASAQGDADERHEFLLPHWMQ